MHLIRKMQNKSLFYVVILLFLVITSKLVVGQVNLEGSGNQYYYPDWSLSLFLSLRDGWRTTGGLTRNHVSARSLMPILATSVVMDTEDYLHPEDPQLGSPKFIAPSPPLPSSMEVHTAPHTFYIVNFTLFIVNVMVTPIQRVPG